MGKWVLWEEKVGGKNRIARVCCTRGTRRLEFRLVQRQNRFYLEFLRLSCSSSIRKEAFIKY